MGPSSGLLGPVSWVSYILSALDAILHDSSTFHLENYFLWRSSNL